MKNTDPAWRRMQIRKILWITLFWVLLGIWQLADLHVTYKSENCFPEGYNAGIWLLVTFVTSLLAGLIGGSVTVVFFERWFQEITFLKALMRILIAYSFIYLGLSIGGVYAVRLLSSAAAGTPSLPVSALVVQDITSLYFIKGYVYWLAILVVTTLAVLINYKYGPGGLRDVILGRHFRPRREDRIFMFLDMRDSTEIAERMSDVEYFKFLRQVIFDVTQPVLYTEGEIYQYVGDLIVISWPMEAGKRQANCVRCFFEVQQILRRKAPKYMSVYGTVPHMKAGLHAGTVLAGQIGLIKRDITYSGDVVNTTARIESQCNELDVDLLISKSLLDQLSLAPHQYHPRRMGEITLKGKSENVVLYTL